MKPEVGMLKVSCDIAEDTDVKVQKIFQLMGWQGGRPPKTDVRAVHLRGQGGMGKTLLLRLVYNSVGAW